MEELVFVYGTLKSGYGNNRILAESSELVSVGVTEEQFSLRDCGFPYMTPKDMVSLAWNVEAPVRGEIWKVKDQRTMDRLDQLEGEGSHYHRQHIEVRNDVGEKLRVQTYLQLNPEITARCKPCEVEDGALVWTGHRY